MEESNILDCNHYFPTNYIFPNNLCKFSKRIGVKSQIVKSTLPLALATKLIHTIKAVSYKFSLHLAASTNELVFNTSA